MNYYRTKTYIAADFDKDRDAVEKLYEWNDNKNLGLSFADVHEVQQSRDDSLPCSIKKSLKERMDMSKIFVLIVGESTKAVTNGGCQFCDNYNSRFGYCYRGYSVDTRSYIKYECDLALDAGIPIILLYKSWYPDRNKSPIWNSRMIEASMREWGWNDTGLWNYATVKEAFDKANRMC